MAISTNIFYSLYIFLKYVTFSDQVEVVYIMKRCLFIKLEKNMVLLRLICGDLTLA